jgi:hypothetical protein
LTSRIIRRRRKPPQAVVFYLGVAEIHTDGSQDSEIRFCRGRGIILRDYRAPVQRRRTLPYTVCFVPYLILISVVRVEFSLGVYIEPAPENYP